jgi:hypothetical protein
MFGLAYPLIVCPDRVERFRANVSRMERSTCCSSKRRNDNAAGVKRRYIRTITNHVSESAFRFDRRFRYRPLCRNALFAGERIAGERILLFAERFPSPARGVATRRATTIHHDGRHSSGSLNSHREQPSSGDSRSRRVI